MARKTKVKNKEWQPISKKSKIMCDLILSDYLVNSNVDAVAEKYGIQPRMIRKYLKAKGILFPRNRDANGRFIRRCV